MYQVHKDFNEYKPVTRAQLDQILDMLAKARNVSMVAMFGDRLKDWANLYVASGNRQTTPEEELEIIKARVDKSGAKAIKFKIGGRMSRNKDSMYGGKKRGPDLQVQRIFRR